MTAHTSARERRLAATFAFATTLACSGGALWSATHLLGLRAGTTDEAVAAAFVAVACACLVRLAWVCGAATLDLLATPAAGTPTESPATTNETAHNSSTRMRAASLFLALAALVGSGAATSSASPVTGISVTATTPAPSPDFGPAPLIEPSAPASPDFEEEPEPRQMTRVCSSAPEPGWVPSSRSVDAHSCRLVMPTGRSSATGTHVVLRGQNLWSIAAAHLPENAPGEVVADAVSAWIEANPSLRENPDIIHAGDVLTVPGSSVGGTR
ncbi:hypothetical protein FV141_09200 [Dermacoccus abyssi]|uniref:LysM domain-containing protein n=1 Tax=Dermacoccus abyssi TaxID=322596 RepID=A0ABX5ZA91_9MICO|nr:hypothetical protein FV141_09200 [Dermacoccus abyssi]